MIADPFYIPIDQLPTEGVLPSLSLGDITTEGRHLNAESASELAQSIVARHEVQLMGKRIPLPLDLPPGHEVTAEEWGRYESKVAADRRETRHWKRLVSTSQDAADLAYYHFRRRTRPPLRAMAHALGVFPEVERWRTGDRLTRRLGQLRAQGNDRQVDYSYLARHVGRSERAVRQMLEYDSVRERTSAIEEFYRTGYVTPDPWEFAAVFHDEVPRQPLPDDVVLRVIAGMRGQAAAARFVCYHLIVRRWPGAVMDALPYALGF